MWQVHGLSPWGAAWLLLSFVLFVAGASPSVVSAALPLARRLAPLENITDLQVQSLTMTVVYVIQYLVLGGVFEGTNPRGSLSTTLPPKHLAARRKQVLHEMYAGIVSLVVTIALSVSWMYAGEPKTVFYAFFEGHEWSLLWAVGGLLAYIASFDTWFYWSHWLLHNSNWAWERIHYFHHQYKEPSAFAQFAVHPVEAALQGPVGHFLVQLWFPVHPLQLAIMGFLSSAWAFAAHDGRGGDFNSHYFHHSKGRGRMTYFNLGFLTPTWDVICGTRWYPEHPEWVKWQRLEKEKKVADTRDGTVDGVPNSEFISDNVLAEDRIEHQKSKQRKQASAK